MKKRSYLIKKNETEEADCLPALHLEEGRSYLILFVSYTFVQCESPLQEPADVGAVKGQEHEGTNTSHTLPLYSCSVHDADIWVL